MNAPAPRSTELVALFEAVLDLPVEAFGTKLSGEPGVQFASLLFDPDVRRLVQALAVLPPHCRAALANVAEAIVEHAAPFQTGGAEAVR